MSSDNLHQTRSHMMNDGLRSPGGTATITNTTQYQNAGEDIY